MIIACYKQPRAKPVVFETRRRGFADYFIRFINGHSPWFSLSCYKERKAVVFSAFMALVITVSVFADDTQHEMSRSMMGRKMMMELHKGSLEHKVINKAHFIINNQAEAGITDQQVVKIRNLNHDLRKKLIEKNAEIEIIELDIKNNLRQDIIDENAVNKLIEKEYTIKEEKAKLLLKTYGAMKNILTKKQKDKLKEILKARNPGYDICPICK